MRFLALTAPLLLSLASPALADTVYAQPGTEACNPSCWTSHYIGGSGFRAYDNFTLGSAATITSVTWQGIYIPQTGSTAPGPDTTSWTIDFFADGSNFPAGSLYSTTLAAGAVTTTQIGSGTFGTAPVNIYSFTAVLPTSFIASAGTQYWFSPLSLAASFDPFFSWSAASATYDGLTAQTDTAGNTYNRPDDRIFSLVSSAVPEPASWAMMVGGFGIVGGAMRARMRPRILAA